MKYTPPMLSAARFRRKLLDGLVQAAIDQEQGALRIHRERPAGIRTGVGDGRLAVPVEFHDRAFIILGEQKSAVFRAHDAVGIVAVHLPDFLPLLSRGDDPRNFRHRVRARRWRGGRGRCLGPGRWRRRLARLDRIRVPRVPGRLHARPLREAGGRQNLAPAGARGKHAQRKREHSC